MKKITGSQRRWLNLGVTLQKRFFMLKKTWGRIFKSARPFLGLKYWSIYLLFFGIGVYLYGPAQGLQKVRSFHLKPKGSKMIAPTLETLQREIEHLKQEIKMEQTERKTVVFTPENFSRPALGQVIQGYTWVVSGNSWRLHPGVDIGVPAGGSVMAAAEGLVSAVREIPGAGFAVTVEHGNGWESIYSNLTEPLVREGQKVIKGVLLGKSGTEGCGLKQPGFHFAIYHDHRPVDPQKIVDGLVR